MNQSEDFGKILKLWPNLVDHYIHVAVMEPGNAVLKA